MPDQPLDFLAGTPALSGGQDSAPGAGPQSPGGGLLSVTQPNDGGGPYSHFGLSVGLAWDSGLASAPIAGPAGSGRVFWRTCSDSSVKVVSFAAGRINGTPNVPHVSTGCDNDVLIGWRFSVPVKQLMPDGSEIIVVVGEYYYEQQQAITPSLPVLIPNTALGLFEAAQIDPATFSRYLSGPVQPPPGYGGGVVNF